jgi:hypothetical protein
MTVEQFAAHVAGLKVDWVPEFVVLHTASPNAAQWRRRLLERQRASAGRSAEAQPRRQWAPAHE